MDLNDWLTEVKIEDLRVERSQVGRGEEGHNFVIWVAVHNIPYDLDRSLNLHGLWMYHVSLVDLGVGLSSWVEIMYTIDRFVIRTRMQSAMTDLTPGGSVAENSSVCRFGER